MSRKGQWPKAVCARCTRIGPRDGFACTMSDCPPALVIVRSAVEYAALCTPCRRQPVEVERKSPRKRAWETARLSHSEISRLGAVARWAKWREKKSQRETVEGVN